MLASDLGKKIKEARLAKKMTQSEVVGNFITRNMLSQIESGSAMPSVKTLDYLSNVLDIPMSELIENASNDAFQVLLDAKLFMSEGDYASVLMLCESIPDSISDELYALGARACLALAKEQISQDTLADVTNLIRRGMDYAERGLYANSSVLNECSALLAQQATRLSQYYLSLTNPPK